MSEETTTQQENVTTANANQRPTFLTVLCILTFIGSGLGILGSLFLVLGMGAILGALGSLGGAATGGTAYAVIGLILSIASLVGAIQMWKLKKTGFYIYTAANVIGILLPVFFGLGFSAIGAIIPVLFIVLYGLNLKHMK